MESKPYREARMYELGRGNKNACVFDFSRISIDDYYGFFNGLPNMVYKKCKSLTFNTELDIKDREDETTSEEKRILNNSIMVLKPRFSHFLYKILNQTMPKSKELNEVIVYDVKIPSNYFSDFVTSLARSRFLRVIELHGITIPDEHAALMFEKLSPFKFTRIVASNCNISSHLYRAVLAFLSQEVPEGKKWKLEVLDLSENFFVPKQMAEIARLLKQRIANPEEVPVIDEEEKPADEEHSASSSSSEAKKRKAKLDEVSGDELAHDDENEYDLIVEEEEEEEEAHEEEEQNEKEQEKPEKIVEKEVTEEEEVQEEEEMVEEEEIVEEEERIEEEEVIEEEEELVEVPEQTEGAEEEVIVEEEEEEEALEEEEDDMEK